MLVLKMKKFFLLVIFLLNGFEICQTEKVICNSTKTIELNENDIVFFESPNFPKAMTVEMKEKCELIVNGNSQKENMEIIFVLTNGRLLDGRLATGNKTEPLIKTKYSRPHYSHTSESSLIFNFIKNENSTNSWELIQGYVTYEPGGVKGCPLANKESPFVFTNDSEFLYLRSSYEKDLLLYEKKCTWEFEAPLQHSFKIKVFRIESEILVISNNERKFIKSRGTYFFNTTNISVSHTTTLNRNHTFSAKIGVVNHLKQHRKDDCKFFDNYYNGVSTWTRKKDNFDTIAKCQQNVTVVPGHQLYATVILYDIETGVDILRYYDNDTDLLHPIEIVTNDTYVFLPYEKGVNRNITWEFKSDESISYKNFSVEFKSIECKCTDEDFIIPCEGEQNFTIMEEKTELYCANLDCSYNIVINKTCSNNSILLKIYPSLANPECDFLEVVSDGEILINTSDTSTKFDEATGQTALILPHRKTTLKFKSFNVARIDKVSGAVINPGVGTLRIWTKSIDEPKIQYREITSTEPLYIFKSTDLNENSVLTVLLSEELLKSNDTLELVYETSNARHLLKCLTLYDNENLSSIRKLNIFNYTTSIGSSITIYKHLNCEKDLSKLIIRAKYAHSINCVFQNNLINVANVMTQNGIVSMISGPHQSCDITLVNNVGQYFINQIWAKDEENVLLYNNANKSDAILKFNEQTSKKWKHMTFNALSYTLKIPANSSVMIEYFYFLHKIYLDQPLSSYFETPFYGTPSFKPVSHNVTYYLPQKFNARFTVVDMDISPDGKLMLITEDENIDLKSVLPSNSTVISGTDNIIDIFYYERTFGYKGAMINIERIYRPINETWIITHQTIHDMFYRINPVSEISKTDIVFRNVYYNFRFGVYRSSNEARKHFSLHFYIYTFKTTANILISFKNTKIKHRFGNTTSNSEYFYLPYDSLKEAEEMFMDGKCEIAIKGMFFIERDEYPIIPRSLDEKLWKGKDKDFDIIVISTKEPERKVKVHKEVLIGESVFEGMLRSGREESTTNTLKIIDFDYKTVNAVVEFFYGQESFNSFSIKEIFEVLRFADKYVIDGLTEYITTFISYRIQPSNVSETANASSAAFNSAIKIQQICIKFLDVCLDQSIRIDNFDTLDKEFAAG